MGVRSRTGVGRSKNRRQRRRRLCRLLELGIANMAFEALEISIQAVAAMRAPVEKLRTRNAGLYKQIVEAGSSLPMNLSEGRRRIGMDRLHHFRIAASSAEESHTGLRVAVAWGQLEAREVEPALELLDRVLRIIWRLTH